MLVLPLKPQLLCLKRKIREQWDASAHAVRMTAPPASLIFFSASLETNLALMTTGWLGSCPFPRTLKRPNLVTSITGATLLSLALCSRAYGIKQRHGASVHEPRLTFVAWQASILRLNMHRIRSLQVSAAAPKTHLLLLIQLQGSSLPPQQ